MAGVIGTAGYRALAFRTRVCEHGSTAAGKGGATVVDDTWLTVGQVADLLGVDVNTARRYADAGRLNDPVPMRRLPARGDRRIHRSSAERLLRELAPDSEKGASTS
jgi:hypothetical protein